MAYLEPTQESGRLFVQRGLSGPVVMLNLLKFRDVADYSSHPDLAPAAPISGSQAFDRYVEHTLPFLWESGGDVLFLGEGGSFLIGPTDECWDRIMLIRQASVASFLSFACHAGYLEGLVIGWQPLRIPDFCRCPKCVCPPLVTSDRGIRGE